jgi:hypothetical protein
VFTLEQDEDAVCGALEVLSALLIGHAALQARKDSASIRTVVREVWKRHPASQRVDHLVSMGAQTHAPAFFPCDDTSPYAREATMKAMLQSFGQMTPPSFADLPPPPPGLVEHLRATEAAADHPAMDELLRGAAVTGRIAPIQQYLDSGGRVDEPTDGRRGGKTLLQIACDENAAMMAPWAAAGRYEADTRVCDACMRCARVRHARMRCVHATCACDTRL